MTCNLQWDVKCCRDIVGKASRNLSVILNTEASKFLSISTCTGLWLLAFDPLAETGHWLRWRLKLAITSGACIWYLSKHHIQGNHAMCTVQSRYTQLLYATLLQQAYVKQETIMLVQQAKSSYKQHTRCRSSTSSPYLTPLWHTFLEQCTSTRRILDWHANIIAQHQDMNFQCQ